MLNNSRKQLVNGMLENLRRPGLRMKIRRKTPTRKLLRRKNQRKKNQRRRSQRRRKIKVNQSREE